MGESTRPGKRGRPKGSATFAWRGYFQQSTVPIFLLGKGRRLRFANAAWEALTGLALADGHGLVCSPRPSGTALARCLAPPPEALAGRSIRCRRSAPNHRTGPPWWDITFIALPGPDAAIGIVGFIEVAGEGAPAAARRVPAHVMALRDALGEQFAIDRVTGDSPAALRLASQLRLAAVVPAPVWLYGESGSGKATAARAIHRASPNRDRAFIALDCTGIQPYLIESLLWGHGGLAESERVGAVYLREPSALPRELQQRFVAQFGDTVAKFPRLICGAAHPAAHDVKSRTLLPEFHTRLSSLEVRLPPLRERLDDLSRLTTEMLRERRIEPAALSVLASHSWPGNLRELKAVLQDAVASAGEGAIQREHIPRPLRERLGFTKPAPEPSLALDAALEVCERQMIQQALAKSKGNATRAAALLHVQRNRLLRRIAALGLAVTDSPTPE